MDADPGECPPSVSSTVPPMSWFAPPEGLYTLVGSFTTPSLVPPPTPQLGAPSTQTAPSIPDGPPTGPPPNHPTRLATCVVKFPLRDQKDVLSPLQSPGALPPASMPIALGGGENGGGYFNSGLDSSQGANGPTSPSGQLRRKPLTSSFSIPTLVSLGQNTGSLEPGGSRPSRPFRGTSSSFVRSWEGLPLPAHVWKPLVEANTGKETIFGFYTIQKGIAWSEVCAGRPKDPLCKLTFSVPTTCVDVNPFTASDKQLDVLVGFATGDIVWLDPISAKYTRLNKSGIISSSPITSIQWLPPSPADSATENVASLFLTSHADGTIIVWDKDREDWNGFVPLPMPAPPPVDMSGKENAGTGSRAGGKKSAPGKEDIVVTRSATVDKKGTKLNPVSHWRLSRKAITAFSFSPDAQLIASVGEDGCLRIMDTAAEILLDTFETYFGSLNCVAWSPDGRFVVTGGQDDLCTVYAPLEQRLVARCQGHSSFVTNVAWDPWRSDERTTRFVSVGEDCKLVLWDLSGAALSRPKTHVAHHHAHRRLSMSSQHSLSRRRGMESNSALPISDTDRSGGAVYHPAPHRDDVSMLQPVMVKQLSHDLFVSLKIHPNHLITASRSGQIKLWDRPSAGGEGLGAQLKEEFAASTVNIDSRRR